MVVSREALLGDGVLEGEILVRNFVFLRRDRDRHGGGIVVGIRKGVWDSA